ncbi:MAG: 4-hydroxy-tetrahydrodipicolinate reductase [Chloroflexi bacterium]|nr:4-hydroxy-tetrahydrodipicolinate reductase [Chloroflexota bacterium]
MAETIRVAVTGASGKMAREVLIALCREPELEPVGAVSRKAVEECLPLPDGSGLIPLSSDLMSIIGRARPQVVVDFTQAEAVMPTAHIAAQNRVNLVIGTTGLSAENLAEIEALCSRHGVGAVVAPNFALGAVLMIDLARRAARFFDYAEIIEMHHEAKADAPSGTALTTAREMVKKKGGPFSWAPTTKENLAGSRGAQLEGIAIHSVRVPGLVAHQMVILGGLGQTLTIRHDSTSRESFMPGVVMAIKGVVKRPAFVYGLDDLLGLDRGA